MSDFIAYITAGCWSELFYFMLMIQKKLMSDLIYYTFAAFPLLMVLI